MLSSFLSLGPPVYHSELNCTSDDVDAVTRLLPQRIQLYICNLYLNNYIVILYFDKLYNGFVCKRFSRLRAEMSMIAIVNRCYRVSPPTDTRNLNSHGLLSAKLALEFIMSMYKKQRNLKIPL